MFRITKDPSSGSDDLYFDITGNGSQISIMCVVSVFILFMTFPAGDNGYK